MITKEEHEDYQLNCQICRKLRIDCECEEEEICDICGEFPDQCGCEEKIVRSK